MSTSTTNTRVSLLCVRCGYDLRGLARDANCPECGTPFARSLYGDYLRHQPPTWLGRMRAGALWCVISDIAILAFSGYWILRHGSYDWVVVESSRLPGVRFAPIALVALYLVGAAFITAKPPIHRERMLCARRILRVSVLTTALLGLGVYVSWLREPPVGAWWVGVTCLNVLTTLTWGIYLRGVALRIPDEWLAFHAMLAAISLAVLDALLNLYPWMVYALAWRGIARLPFLRTFPLALGTLCFSIYSTYLAARFYRAFGVARAEALASVAEPAS